jgi:hypothetical protein
MTELRGVIPITATPFDAEGWANEDGILVRICDLFAAGAAEMYDRYASHIRCEGLRAILERAGILETRRAICRAI